MPVKVFKPLHFELRQIERDIDGEHHRLSPDWARLPKLETNQLSIQDRLARRGLSIDTPANRKVYGQADYQNF